MHDIFISDKTANNVKLVLSSRILLGANFLIFFLPDVFWSYIVNPFPSHVCLQINNILIFKMLNLKLILENKHLGVVFLCSNSHIISPGLPCFWVKLFCVFIMYLVLAEVMPEYHFVIFARKKELAFSLYIIFSCSLVMSRGLVSHL